MPSRGICISAYNAAFSKGAKVYGAQIQSGVITSAHIADGTVVAAEVAAGAITSAKLGTGAVTSVKLGAASVISAKIGTGAVLAANLGAGSVISAKIGAAAVTSAKLGASSVTNAKMKAAFLSGTLVSGRIALPVAHGLGVKPKSVVVCPLLTVAQAASAVTLSGKALSLAPTVGVVAASAATSANIYLIGSQAGNTSIKYAAYIQI
jgi:hypothetical protein